MSRGSRRAVERLAGAHRELLAFVERRVGDRATAEDILHAAFVRGLERAGELRRNDRVVAWFYALLRNATTDHFRARAVETAARERLGRESPEATLPQAEAEAALCDCFRALLPGLKPEYRELIEAVDLGDAEPTAVAERLGITPNNARVRLHRARRALRRELELACRTCAEHGCLDCSCARPARRQVV